MPLKQSPVKKSSMHAQGLARRQKLCRCIWIMHGRGFRSLGGRGEVYSPEQINPSSVMLLCVYVRRCLCSISRRLDAVMLVGISPFICFCASLIRTPLRSFFQVFSLELKIPNHRFLLGSTSKFLQVGLGWGRFDVISNICYIFPSNFFLWLSFLLSLAKHFTHVKTT